MGIVAMEVADSFLSRGYSHFTQAVYVYCDACGSFRVKKILSGRQLTMILGSFFILAYFMYRGLPWLGLVLIALFLCIPIAGLWGIPGYQCLKCGRTTTIQYNTRNYPLSMSIVDVPAEQIEKFYFNYWPDEGDLAEHLKPPEPRADENGQNQK